MEASRDLGNVDPWQESLERSLARRGKLPDGPAADALLPEAPAPDALTPEPLTPDALLPDALLPEASAAPVLARPRLRRHRDRLRPSAPDRPRTPAEERPPARRQDRPARSRTRHGVSMRSRSRRAPDGRRPRSRTRIRWDRLLTAGSGGLLAIVFLVVVTAGGVAGRGAQASVDASRATAYRHPARAHRTGARAPGAAFTPIRMPGAGRCQPAGAGSGYVNPLAGDVLRGERIDQGVDYAGTGTLRALGLARVTYVGTAETGWPGAFIEFRLLAGPDAGCFVYYAEGINPVPGLHAGQRIRPGQRLADIIPGWSTGIELGWGAGASTKTYAARVGRWSPTDDANNVPTASGRSFSALIAALGGPPGKIEG